MRLITRCSAAGSAPVSGTGGREFESRHFDQKRKREPLWFSFLFVGVGNENFTLRSRMEFAYSAQRASSLLVSRKREHLAIGNTSTLRPNKALRAFLKAFFFAYCDSFFVIRNHIYV